MYSLAFGEEADFAFLRRLSSENFGFARRIYDAEDAAIQLHEVYAELSAPVLADLAFTYPDTVVGHAVIATMLRNLEIDPTSSRPKPSLTCSNLSYLEHKNNQDTCSQMVLS